MCIKFEGRVLKDGKYWLVYVPALEVYTQGKSKKDAYWMIKDAVELHLECGVNHKTKVVIIPMPKNKFVLKASNEKDDKYLVALMLKRCRQNYGLTLDAVARRLGVAKRTYAQYEQGRSLPSLAKIEECVRAMCNQAHVVLNVLGQEEFI